MFGVVSLSLAKIKSIFVLEDFKVFTFDKIFNFEIFLNGLVVLQVVDILLFLWYREEASRLVNQIHVFIFLTVFRKPIFVFSFALLHLSLRLLGLFLFKQLENSAFILPMSSQSVCQVVHH